MGLQWVLLSSDILNSLQGLPPQNKENIEEKQENSKGFTENEDLFTKETREIFCPSVFDLFGVVK